MKIPALDAHDSLRPPTGHAPCDPANQTRFEKAMAHDARPVPPQHNRNTHGTAASATTETLNAATDRAMQERIAHTSTKPPNERAEKPARSKLEDDDKQARPEDIPQTPADAGLALVNPPLPHLEHPRTTPGRSGAPHRYETEAKRIVAGEAPAINTTEQHEKATDVGEHEVTPAEPLSQINERAKKHPASATAAQTREHTPAEHEPKPTSCEPMTRGEKRPPTPHAKSAFAANNSDSVPAEPAGLKTAAKLDAELHSNSVIAPHPTPEPKRRQPSPVEPLAMAHPNTPGDRVLAMVQSPVQPTAPAHDLEQLCRALQAHIHAAPAHSKGGALLRVTLPSLGAVEVHLNKVHGILRLEIQSSAGSLQTLQMARGDLLERLNKIDPQLQLSLTFSSNQDHQQGSRQRRNAFDEWEPEE